MKVNKQPPAMQANEIYLRNTWYQAAWSYEVGQDPFVRTILETPILLFRSEGKLVAMLDRCPHRFAPLSAGKIEKGVIECPYHGLAFDGTGSCVRNPHGPVTSVMRTASYPVVERHQAVWIWLGDAEAADEDLIPDLSFVDEMPEDIRILMYMPTAANYRLLSDNIMDLSHADYLHPASLGGVIADAKSRQYDRERSIVAEWINLDCNAPGVWQGKYPAPSKIDYKMEVEWQAPAVMTLANTVVPAGVEPTPADLYPSLHNMVPENGKSSHYFMCASRPEHFPSDNKAMKEIYEQAFLREDKPMIEAQQSRMGDAEFWSLNPILLKIDAAGVKVRRRLDQMIAAEQQSSGQDAPSA
jgi:phenylpropionate dioxygenase-like ring-hydroxylating dioxygenase large terminal subunit